ncbi:serine/threonine-protein kinase MRCK alpha-like [Corticium candelabrum]|uniref:serine/threonine-protein kinase MRCK alpha-like n=1 Tax=Corticium candelabrum TaxID=121492 RepID=UPI002E27163E|nr:serine/threonine-protein kinase MRCK alpha-like [Corticium candelabrum]
MAEELDTIKSAGAARRSASGTWQNRKTYKQNKQELLSVQADLRNQVEAKQKLVDEKDQLEGALTASETKLRESEMLNRDIIEQMNRLRMDRDLLQKELEMIRSKSQDNVSSRESTMSFRTFLNSTDPSGERVRPIATSSPTSSEPATPTRLPLNESAVVSAVATAAAVVNAALYAGEIKEEEESESTSAPESPAITLLRPKKVVPSPKMPRGKPHHFQVKTFLKPTKCHHCTSIMIGLVRQGMCCEVCHYSCHFHCAEKVPYPCPTSSDKSMRLSGIDPKKGIGTACEGWVKVPKPGGVKKGWLRHYAIVCDFKLFLYEPTTPQEKEKAVSVSIVTTVDMRDELFEVGGVQKSDVIHAPLKLLPNIFKVVASAYNTNGPQAQLLVLTESPNEQRRWVNVLRELKKALSQTEQPARTIYTAKEVYDTSQLEFIRETTCAAVVDSDRIVVGTEEGLYGVELTDDAVLLVEKEKRVYQLEVIPDEQLVAVLSGRQKHVRLYPLPALDGQQLEGVVKVQESKGAQVFAWGPIRVGALNCLCVAVKKKVYVYELNKTRLKHRKIKEMVTQRETQWMGVFNGKLCVGYASGFVLYSVQGEGQATSLIHKDDLSLGFVTLNPLDAMCCIELDQKKEYLLCFNMLGVYVDAQGRRARRQELMWPSLPLSISYSAPYVIVCSQNTVDIFDVVTAEWLQTLPQKRTHALCRDGSLVLWHGSDSPKLLFLKGAHLDDSDAELCVPDGNCRGRRPHFIDKRASKRRFSSRHLVVGGSGARTAISNPSNFSHIQHVGPDAVTANLVSRQSDEELNKLVGKPSRAASAIPSSVASKTRPAKRAVSASALKSSSPAPSSSTLTSLSNGPNDSVAIPRHLSDQQSLHNENILQVDPTTGGMSMRRSSIGSAGSSFPHSIRENSPSNVSQSSDILPTDEPPPAYAPPPIDDFEAGRQSRDGSVGQDALSVGDTEGSPPPAYTFPPTDDWGLDEVDTFKTEC